MDACHAAAVAFFHHLGIPWAGVTTWATVAVIGGALLAMGQLTRIVTLLLMVDTPGIVAFSTGKAGMATGWGYQALMLAGLIAPFVPTFRPPEWDDVR